MTNEEIVKNLVLLSKSFDYLYDAARTENGHSPLSGVGHHYIQVPTEAFKDLFKENITVHSRKCDTYPWELHVLLDSVKIMTICSNEELEKMFKGENE